MARKSNKTAHVLNLLSGPKDEPEKEEALDAAAAPQAAGAEAPAEAPAPSVPSNISVISAGPSEDPVADQIHADLLRELGEPEPAAQAAPAPEPVLESGPEPPVQAAPVPEPVLEPEPKPAAAPAPEPVLEPEPKPAAAPVPEPVLKSEPEPAAQAAPVPEPKAQPEPDFASVNVIQEIVEDKIVYFMKQFDVCMCPRCRADVISLTLNGIPPKYIVVDKAAVNPLLSFYTNKYISQITVEALKACTIVSENPRH